MKILVTGAAGFIGSKLMFTLAQRGDEVVGIDNMNDYYDVRLKEGRIAEFLTGERKRFLKMDIADKEALDALFAAEGFDAVVNLAAQAGVRYSITNPYAYLQSNLVGFLNILEACRNYPVKHLVFASSSSVYGLNAKVPYSEDDKVDNPVSLYAASKKSNELMAHAYAKLYGIPCTGLRFFTVYGPWGRPDMAPMLFASAITKGEPIKVFNGGDMIRDFTYIDDIVEG
ncbi:MAG: NAD-dependent epimerase/dehydratase family protein, partial [Bacteroidales bacterium]|nr:NAD-dependent epimerase/dehydratase family protein [Bacteroidales bacterium]